MTGREILEAYLMEEDFTHDQWNAVLQLLAQLLVERAGEVA